MATPSEQLTDITARHQIYLEGYKASELEKVEAFLRNVQRDVLRRLSSVEISEQTRVGLREILTAVKKDLAAIGGKFTDGVLETVRELAEYEAEFMGRALERTQFVATKLPSPEQIHAAVFSTPLSIADPGGSNLLEPFLAGLAPRTQQRIENAIRMGYFQGETTGQVIQRIRGTKAAGYRDGIIGRTRTDATAMVRTALQHAAMASRQKFTEANKDIAPFVMIVATLDARTSMICRSLDGQVYPQDSGPRPPFHVNCRTGFIPISDSEATMMQGAKRPARFADKYGRFVRGPKKGQLKLENRRDLDRVSFGTKYYDYLKKQPPSFIDSVIGPQRRRLLLNGGISADRFAAMQLDKRFRPLTLKQMRELEPLAFEKAGISFASE